MWYIEYVRARRALTVYAIVVAAIVALALLIRLNVHVQPGRIGPMGVQLDVLSIAAGFMIAILGTVLATSLSSHVNGHLEIAWTKPIPRDRLVAQTFAVDIGALAIAYAATVVVFIGLAAVYGASLDFSLSQLGHFVAELLFPIAFYALVQGVTAAIGRRAGMLAGLSWPILLFITGVIHAPVPYLLQRVILAINYLNPLSLISVNIHPSHSSDIVALNALGVSAWSAVAIGDALLIMALGFVLALVQWRRLEA